MKLKKIIGDICQDEPCRNKDGYCLLKEIIASMGPSERTLIQIKLVERQKWTWSKEANRDIGWHESWERWVNDGYAKIFADVFGQIGASDINEIHEEINRRAISA